MILINSKNEEEIFTLLSRIDNIKFKCLLDGIDIKGEPEVSDLTMERTKVLLFKKINDDQTKSSDE